MMKLDRTTRRKLNRPRSGTDKLARRSHERIQLDKHNLPPLQQQVKLLLKKVGELDREIENRDRRHRDGLCNLGLPHSGEICTKPSTLKKRHRRTVTISRIHAILDQMDHKDREAVADGLKVLRYGAAARPGD